MPNLIGMSTIMYQPFVCKLLRQDYAHFRGFVTLIGCSSDYFILREEYMLMLSVLFLRWDWSANINDMKTWRDAENDQNRWENSLHTYLFNFSQPFIILSQLSHEGLVLQPFLVKFLGLVSAAVPRHPHFLINPVSQLEQRAQGNAKTHLWALVFAWKNKYTL